MARNTKPLLILVDDSLLFVKQIKALVTAGHTVVGFSDYTGKLTDIDMIMSQKAWRMTQELAETAKLVEVAVKANRAAKFPRSKKTKEDEDDG